MKRGCPEKSQVCGEKSATVKLDPYLQGSGRAEHFFQKKK